MNNDLYFAYGSNMDTRQMDHRCPAAKDCGAVRLEGYRLSFGRGGVATILPDPKSHVDGVLWKLTSECERSLDFYEGYPRLYSKETITVQHHDVLIPDIMVYTLNAPYRDEKTPPSPMYFDGIRKGYEQHGIDTEPLLAAQHESLESKQKKAPSKARKSMQR